jgi:WD40 repeat protein
MQLNTNILGIIFFNHRKNRINNLLSSLRSKSLITLLKNNNYKYNQSFLITSSEDKTIRFWDLTSKYYEPLRLHDYGIYSVIILSKDLFASGCYGGVLKITSINENKVINTIKHQVPIFCLIKYNDNSLIVGDGNGWISVINYTNSEIVKQFKAHSDHIYSILLFNDDTLISAGKDCNIKFWKDFELIKTIEEDSKIVGLIKIRENEFAYICNKFCKFYNLAEDKVVREFSRLRIINTFIKLDEDLMASAGEDRRVTIWKIESLEVVSFLPDHSSFINFITKFNNNLIAAASHDYIKVWNFKTKQCINTFFKTYGNINYLTKLNKNCMISANMLGVINIIDIYSEQRNIPCDQKVTSMLKWERDTIITGGLDGLIRLWRFKGHQECDFYKCFNVGEQIYCMSIYKGDELLTGGYTIKCFSLKTYSKLWHYYCSYTPTLAVFNYKDIACNKNSEIRIYEPSRSSTRELSFHDNDVTKIISFESFIISAGNDMNLSVIDGLSLTLIKSFKPHNGFINCLEKLNRNEYTTSGSDLIINIWSSKNHGLLMCFPCENKVFSIFKLPFGEFAFGEGRDLVVYNRYKNERRVYKQHTGNIICILDLLV